MIKDSIGILIYIARTYRTTCLTVHKIELNTMHTAWLNTTNVKDTLYNKDSVDGYVIALQLPTCNKIKLNTTRTIQLNTMNMNHSTLWNKDNC